MGKRQKEKKRKGPYGIEELMAGVPSSDAPREKAAKKDKSRALRKKKYERELGRLQIELVKMQEWIKQQGLRLVVIFEGRDAAGKGGVIKRVTEKLNPRHCRVVALPSPSQAEKTQWQRILDFKGGALLQAGFREKRGTRSVDVLSVKLALRRRRRLLSVPAFFIFTWNRSRDGCCAKELHGCY